MKKGHVYTLVFMVALSAVLTFALAASYEGFKPAIRANKELQEQRAVLYALGLDKDLKDGMVGDAYTANVEPASVSGAAEVAGVPVLAHVKDGEPVAYAVPFEGAGLWGALRGYLGLKASLDEITGLVFTYQNETPGLGGRINESWFKEQFRGVPVREGVKLAYGAAEGGGLDAVTGATQTSSAVLRTLNKLLAEVVFSGEGK